MPTDKRVVVYGASGYTGRLICEYLREYNIPFLAAGRDEGRVKGIVDVVPGIETVEYDVVEVDHTAAALAEAFRGAEMRRRASRSVRTTPTPRVSRTG